MINTRAVHSILVQRYGPWCLACGLEPAIFIDHIIPQNWGGSDNTDNLQPLCRRCNSRKGDKMAIDYRQSPPLLVGQRIRPHLALQKRSLPNTFNCAKRYTRKKYLNNGSPSSNIRTNVKATNVDPEKLRLKKCSECGRNFFGKEGDRHWFCSAKPEFKETIERGGTSDV